MAKPIELEDLRNGKFYLSGNGNRFCILSSFALGESFAHYTNCARFAMIEYKGKFDLVDVRSIKTPISEIP